MEELLRINPVFSGLTRPPMMMGITMDYLSLCILFVISLFILLNSLTYLLIYLPLHAIGWLACKVDPNIFRILLKRIEFTNVPNKKWWRCQSYEAL
ncbi:MAG: VirB3 family type IV secretion system protein [Pseudomonadota bacterium]|nr:VirB3 family type IV secretion system protein [Gammaproteobacteria bacterium]MBU1559047.1 VirB3 family type IV secretion system protein [Gammaproteobacteria bacterium]MBU1629057.1 VirB3 family type IV secretion system protein [Gammaproteobacteria bacterium]MBU1927075.1 VirB3 family type IV secretion system protein [Gammaproteobacteria bacterium]MBU2546531.1 VirB3 family type IV secretion system protein [Gammaproteobacteria bacterium]